MALIQPASDRSGNEYPAAYWRATTIAISAINGVIAVEFRAWKDAGAFAGGRDPIPGLSKTYTIAGADFAAVAAAAPAGASLYDVLANATEAYALAKLDTPTGQAGAGGGPAHASFFAGSEQV